MVRQFSGSADGVRERMADVRERVARAATAAGRDPAGVRILVATKYVAAEHLGVLRDAGIRLIGENRAQDLVRKHELYGDAFEDTNLEEVLAGRGVGRLYIAGAQTDACVRSTLHGAFTRGYDTVLVSDAHTTEDLSSWGAPPPELVIAHTNLYWQYQSAPGREAAVVTAAQAFG